MGSPFAPPPVVTILVVVHIVHKTKEENISSLQVFRQINVLNQDYRMLNTDIVNIPDPNKPLAADACIEFQLAKRDPDGNRWKSDYWNNQNPYR